MILLPMFVTYHGQSKRIFNYGYAGYSYSKPVARIYRRSHQWPYNLNRKIRCIKVNQ